MASAQGEHSVYSHTGPLSPLQVISTTLPKMRTVIILILTIQICLQSHGQNTVFYKTVKKQGQYYLEISNGIAKVYKMGKYIDKAGSGPAIIKIDTLNKITENEFNGKLFSVIREDGNYVIKSEKGKKLNTEIINDLKSIYLTLNNAYYLKSYFDLSERINAEFPLYHYTFRNGYYAWNKLIERNYNHEEFKIKTNNELKLLYDSIFQYQTKLTNTTNFLIKNANQIEYNTIIDSLRILPIEYSSNSWYFGSAVYQISKANPEYFYKILADFPTNKTVIYFAVNKDKLLVEQLKQVPGYENLKREFIKDYKFGRSMPYKIIIGYAVLGGLLTWLILSQK